jgi:hypothetical protein
MRTRLTCLISAAIGLLFAAGSVHAEGTMCLAETDIVPDGRIFQSVIFNGTTFWFGTHLKQGRSYVIEVRYTIAPFGTRPIVTGFQNTNIACVTPIANVRSLSTGFTGDPSEDGTADRTSFTAAVTGFYSWSVQNNTGFDQNYSFTIFETTMYSPAWTTNGTFDTYYSFQNTTAFQMCAASTPCTLTLLDNAGVVANSVTIPPIDPGKIFGTNTATLGVTRNKVGSARFSHDGPPGAILIKANQANFALSPPFIELVPFQAVRQTQ